MKSLINIPLELVGQLHRFYRFIGVIEAQDDIIEGYGKTRHIVGKGGQMISRLGQDARKEIERFLGVRVFLELFVRVDKDWSQSARMLRELGYE